MNELKGKLLGLEKFKKYKNIFMMAFNKNHPLTESLLWKFKEGYVYSFNEKMVCRLKTEKYDYDDISVLTDKFLIIPTIKEEINYDNEKKVFFTKNEKFQITTDASYFTNIPEFEHLDLEKIDLSVINSYLLDAKYYMDANNFYNSLNGIFINQNRIISTNKKSLYIKQLKDNIKDLILNETIIDILLYLDLLNDKIELQYNKEQNKYYLIINDELEIIIPEINKLQLPPIEKLQQEFKYKIEINKKEILEAIIILQKFNNESLMLQIYKDHLNLCISEGMVIEKDINIINSNIEEDCLTIFLQPDKLKKSISIMEDDNIVLRINEKKFLTKINEKNKTNTEVLLCTLKVA